MGPFEYLLLFAAVILGLAVTDLTVSLHRLMSAHERVRWDMLAPLAGLVAFLKIVTQWWTWFSAEALVRAFTFEMYLIVLTEAVLLFLLAAAALPDEVPAAGIDLRAYYERIRRRFWILFLLQWMLWTGLSIWVQFKIGGASRFVLSPAFLVAPACLALAFLRWRIVQAAGLIGFTVIYLLQYFGHTLQQ